MSERVIPIISQPLGNLPVPEILPADAWQSGQALRDQRNRPLRDLRISVTDRCNFRCSYCMPKEIFNNDYVYLPHSALLSFEEITRTAQSFIELGVEKIRLTGGEPLLGWQRAYEELLSHASMADLQNITFETNGTQELQPKFRQFLLNWTLNNSKNSLGRPRTANNLTFSVSAKLSASGERWEDAIRPEVVASYQDIGTTYLKFVVETDEHFAEVDRAVREFRAGGFRGVVYVMPQGGVVTPYDQNRVRVADWAVSQGYYYSPRLHVDLWGNGWGK